MGKPLFTRAFLLSKRHERGLQITTEVIRRDMRVSKATAKRDMKRLRRLVPVLPAKPYVDQRHSTAQRTLREGLARDVIAALRKAR